MAGVAVAAADAAAVGAAAAAAAAVGVGVADAAVWPAATGQVEKHAAQSHCCVALVQGLPAQTVLAWDCSLALPMHAPAGEMRSRGCLVVS